MAWPADDARNAHAAFPGGQLAAFEGGGATVGVGDDFGAVVGGENDDGVVEFAHVFQLLQDVADVIVHLLHADFVDAPVLAAGRTDHRLVLGRKHGGDVHAGRVVPDEEGLPCILRVVAVEEVDDLGRDLLVHRPRAVQRQRALVLAGLVRFGAVGGGTGEYRSRRHHAQSSLLIHRTRNLGEAAYRGVFAGRDNGLIGRGLVDVGEANALHGVQVVEVTPEFLEAVRRRQRCRVVTQVVLAEFAGGVAQIEQELGQRRRSRLQEGRAAGQLWRNHAGAQRRHAGEERDAPSRTALLGVVGRHLRTFTGDAVDVGRGIGKGIALRIGADIHQADIVAHDEHDVGLLLLRRDRNCCQHHNSN